MKKEEFSYRSNNDLADIRAVSYIPDTGIKAILQIAHGMDEFIDRYDDFAAYLNSKGFLVVGNDHLGHGGSVNSPEEWGYFGDHGNQTLLEDMHRLTELTKEIYPDLPYFLLGHSMGSFYARQYITTYGKELKGAIIMGTGFEPLYKLNAAKALCRSIALVKGWKHRSTFVNDMAFGSYNKRFEPARTRVDWLTKDEAIVDKYVAEPRCNFIFTLNGYYSMFEGIARLHNKDLLRIVPKNLPVLFVSGEDDPVGSFGKEVINAAKSLKDAGVLEVAVKLYPNDRHEILNELDKDIVYDDLYNWMIEHM
ncbi:MAG: alpha/beta fold hydrolase [Erysipelotrichaceae bacterium]|nr:alpha/beta fold hydrolase [Erysipelotrichaceae bacterium]